MLERTCRPGWLGQVWRRRLRGEWQRGVRGALVQCCFDPAEQRMVRVLPENGPGCRASGGRWRVGSSVPVRALQWPVWERVPGSSCRLAGQEGQPMRALPLAESGIHGEDACRQRCPRLFCRNDGWRWVWTMQPRVEGHALWL
jgi:hypothetical protein